MSAPTVSRIYVYPIKSLGRVEVAESAFVPGGGLAHDREFALFNPNGDVMTMKREPGFHRIDAKYDLKAFTVTLEGDRFHLLDDRPELERWFSDAFGFAVTMRRDTKTGFPDDLESPGPTIVSEATLAEVNAWFPELDRDQVARRFRANIEIGGVPAFWEDRLFGEPEEVVGFRVGDVAFQGNNPCARCAVPSRHPDTGDVNAEFQKVFREKREETLPNGVALGRFNHFYRLCVNTRVPGAETGKVIKVGDAIKT